MDSTVVADRYTRSPRLSRRGKNILGAVGVAALTAAVSAVAWPASNPPITSTVLAYHVDSDTVVSVQFEVDMAAGRTAVCTIQARDKDGNVVGTRDVPIPANPSGAKATVLSEKLKTTGLAIVGEVLQCSLTN